VYFTYSYPAPTGQNPQAGGVLAYVLTTITGTPTLSELAASPFVALAEPTDIVIAGGFAYLTDFGANFLSQYSLASATLSPLSPSGQPSGAGPMSVAVTTSYH
jgi:DNA-binding beta-propeller fold protein YncE